MHIVKEGNYGNNLYNKTSLSFNQEIYLSVGTCALETPSV